jgi:DNA-binding transcriptional LysR family regulator
VQSNVSARIRKLERHFGQSLFVRLHRGVSPTAAARSLYPEAKNLIALSEQIQSRIRKRSATSSLANSCNAGNSKTVNELLSKEAISIISLAIS